MRRRWRLLVVAAVAVSLVAAACGEKEEKPEASPKATGAGFSTLEKGTIKVGSDISYAPFEFSEGGENKGFDIDLMNEICEHLSQKCVFENTAFDGIFAALAANKFDAIASSITITPERQKQVSFTDPYFNADQSLTVNVTRTPNITSEADLAGQVVGVQSGTTGEEYAKTKISGLQEVKSYDTINDAFSDLQAGRIAGIINDFPVSAYIVRDKPDLKVVAEIKTDEQYGIGVNKKNTKLLAALNDELQHLKDEGTYAEIYKKWFGKEPTSIP